MQASTNKPKGHLACFPILPSVIFRIGRLVPIEVFRKGKVYAVLGDIGLSFEVVPFVYHRLTVHTIIMEINSGGAPTGLLKKRLTDWGTALGGEKEGFLEGNGSGGGGLACKVFLWVSQAPMLLTGHFGRRKDSACERPQDFPWPEGL